MLSTGGPVCYLDALACIVLCCNCGWSPYRLSHLGSSVAEHSSREQSVMGLSPMEFLMKHVFDSKAELARFILN